MGRQPHGADRHVKEYEPAGRVLSGEGVSHPGGLLPRATVRIHALYWRADGDPEQRPPLVVAIDYPS